MTSFIASCSFCHRRSVAHRSCLGQSFSSMSIQATGARLPSIRHRMLPAVYSCGARIRRSTAALDKARLVQHGDNLLQILFRNLLPSRNILDAHRLVLPVHGDIHHEPQRISPSRRNLHFFSSAWIFPAFLVEARINSGLSCISFLYDMFMHVLL